MKRLECLDGLRGALAVYVMLGHMAPFAAVPGWLAQPFSHGNAAVDIFFILSGLVITQSLDSFRYQAGPFLTARIVRIFPVYLVMLAIAVAVQPLPAGFERMGWIDANSPARAIWSQGWPHQAGARMLAHLTMTHGLFPAGVLPDVWVSFLGAAWSLSTEWQFYVLALLLGRAGLRAPCMVALFLALGLAGVMWHDAMPETWQFSRAFLPNKAQYFALGIASTAVVRGNDRSGPLFGMALLSVLLLSGLQGSAGKLLPPLIWSLCLAAQMQFGLPGLAVLSAALRTTIMLWLGAVSYPLYLANEPIQKALGCGLSWITQGNANLFTAVWVPAAILLPLGAAAWLHRHVERPAQRQGRLLARVQRRFQGGQADGH
jgi:peptidoglycan/LPS O-acetylase OafA/YrhL